MVHREVPFFVGRKGHVGRSSRCRSSPLWLHSRRLYVVAQPLSGHIPSKLTQVCNPGEREGLWGGTCVDQNPAVPQPGPRKTSNISDLKILSGFGEKKRQGNPQLSLRKCQIIQDLRKMGPYIIYKVWLHAGCRKHGVKTDIHSSQAVQ